MKTSLDHLPAAKQRKIRHIVRIIRDEVAQVTEFATGKKKQSRILMIILFGSYKGTWVEDPIKGGRQ